MSFRRCLTLLALTLALTGCPSGEPSPPAPGPTTSPPPAPVEPAPPATPSEPPKVQASMVKIPAGSFLLGSIEFPDEHSGERILISDFEIDAFEVTNAQYRGFLDAIKDTGLPGGGPLPLREAFPKGKDHTPTNWGTPEYEAVSPTDDHPVVWVDWYDALAYAHWAGKRLPTECEWEKAAGWDAERRAKRLFPWGDVGPEARGVYRANFKPVLGAGLDGYVGLAKAQAFEIGATPQGVFNLGGNVAEWCQDWYIATYKNHGDADPTGPATGHDKVVRGGSYLSVTADLRTTARLFADPLTRQPFIGFRCAR